MKSTLPLLLVTCLAAPASAEERTRPDADGFIRDWLVMTPSFYDPNVPLGHDQLDREQLAGEARLRPRAGAAAEALGQKVTWTAHAAPGPALDLNAVAGLPKTMSVIGYAVTYVVSDAARPRVQLRVGSNDQVRGYLDGRLVVRYADARELRRDQDITVVSLKKGLNPLVFKVLNTEARWELAARFTDADGKPIPGLRVTTDPAARPADAAATPDGEGFIRHWLVLAPIDFQHRPYAEGQLARRQLPDEDRLEPRADDRRWVNGIRVWWKPWKAEKEGFIDFLAFARTQRDWLPKAAWEANDSLFNTFSYAVAYVHAPHERRDLVAKIGANDHGKLYVNGKAVAALDAPGPLRKDGAGGKVTLKKGVNVLVFKVLNSGDDWQGCVRFVDGGGKPVTDLEIGLEPPVRIKGP